METKLLLIIPAGIIACCFILLNNNVFTISSDIGGKENNITITASLQSVSEADSVASMQIVGLKNLLKINISHNN